MQCDAWYNTRGKRKSADILLWRQVALSVPFSPVHQNVSVHITYCKKSYSNLYISLVLFICISPPTSLLTIYNLRTWSDDKYWLSTWKELEPWKHKPLEMLPVGKHLDWLNWSGKTHPTCGGDTIPQTRVLSWITAGKELNTSARPCDQLPRAPAAKPSPPWWTVSPYTVSQDKLFIALVASFRLFGHNNEKRS